MTEPHPKRRRTDRTGWQLLRWAYNHALPPLSMALAAWAIAGAEGAQEATRTTAKSAEATAVVAQQAAELALASQRAQLASRRRSLLESCALAEAQTNLIRTILGLRAPSRTAAERARADVFLALLRPLFTPLGGLRPLTQAEQDARCQARADRSLGALPTTRSPGANP